MNPDTFPPDIARLMDTGILPSQQIEHGYTPGGRRYTQRRLETGAVVFEERSPGSSPIDQRYLSGITAEVRYRKPMAAEDFAEAWATTENQRVSKTRYPFINLNGPLVTVDVFEDRPDMAEAMAGHPAIGGKMLAVVHFESVDQALDFVAPETDRRPSWLDRNVTSVVSSKKLAQGKTWHLEGTANLKTLGTNPSS